LFASSTGGNFVVQYYCPTTDEGFAMTEKHIETPHILHDLPLDQSDQAHFHFDDFAEGI
jgi:hypothetical protein